MRLKLDENLGLRWVSLLRAAGRDVDTVHDEGLRGADDQEVLEGAVGAACPGHPRPRLLGSLRFPPAEAAGIAALRVSDRPSRDEIDAVVERLTEALASAELAGHPWVADPRRVRQYQPPDS